MNDRTPSTTMRAISRLCREARSLLMTDPARAVLIAEDARQRLLTRPLASVYEQRKLAEALLLIARGEQRITHTDMVLQYAEEALQIFESIGAAEDRAWALSVIGVTYWKKGEHNTAYEFFSQCMDILGEGDYPELKTTVLANMGMVCWYLGHYDRALKYLKQSVAISEQAGDYWRMSGALRNIGHVYANNGDDAHALESYFRGITVIEAHLPKAKLDLGVLLGAIGSVFLRAGEYDRALEHYMRGHTIVSELGDRSEIATALMNIGLVFKETGALETAREYIAACLAIQEEQQEPRRVVSLINLSDVLSGLGRHEEALVHAEQCIAICRASGDRRVLSYGLHTGGRACLELGNADEGLSRLQEGLLVCREIHYSKGVLAISLDLALALDRAGQTREGYTYLLEALSDPGAADKLLIRRVRQVLAELCEKLGDVHGALAHYKQAYELNDSIFNEKSERRLQVLHMVYQVEEARKEAEIYRLRTEQLEHKVEEQHREVAAKTMHLSQRVEFLHKVKKMLAATLQTPPDEVHKSVRQLMAVVDNALHDDDIWNSFEAQFRQAHPAFIEAVRQRWPQLSSVEIRVCCLLRLNMSSKEICRILNIASRSVDVYRYRIRRKLELDPEGNLTAFLAGIS